MEFTGNLSNDFIAKQIGDVFIIHKDINIVEGSVINLDIKCKEIELLIYDTYKDPDKAIVVSKDCILYGVTNLYQVYITNINNLDETTIEDEYYKQVDSYHTLYRLLTNDGITLTITVIMFYCLFIIFKEKGFYTSSTKTDVFMDILSGSDQDLIDTLSTLVTCSEMDTSLLFNLLDGLHITE